jgi:hypothetical protein
MYRSCLQTYMISISKRKGRVNQVRLMPGPLQCGEGDAFQKAAGSSQRFLSLVGDWRGQLAARNALPLQHPAP